MEAEVILPIDLSSQLHGFDALGFEARAKLYLHLREIGLSRMIEITEAAFRLDELATEGQC